MNSYRLASASGLTFGFYFFLAFSAVMAVVIFSLLTRSHGRATWLGAGTVRKPVAVLIVLLFWIVLFSTIYFSALAGFHTVAASDRDIRLEYAIPHRVVALRHAEIGEVIRRPAFRALWRLEIYTVTGSRFESAPGPYRSIKEAAEEIDRRRKRRSARLHPSARPRSRFGHE